MKLSNMFNNQCDREINQLISDSRQPSQQGLYFALKGLTHDGHEFIQQAVDLGAVAVVHSEPINNPIEGIEYVLVDDVMTELHRSSNVFFDNPSSKLKIHGITGTNGKTTTMKTVYNILRSMGISAGYVGTVSVEYDDVILEPTLSTPDIIYLQTLYSEMVKAGVTEVCQEVSSQGLSLRRVDGIRFSDASFTNLTHDHLDYHKTMESYFEAKKVLFDRLDKDAHTIINADDPYGERLLQLDYPHMVSLGIEKDADYRATDIVLGASSTQFNLLHKGQTYAVHTNFAALFNVYNALNIIAILHEDGHSLEVIIDQLAQMSHVEGRLTTVDEGQDFLVYVDFAHAPDSMANVYEYVRSILSKENKLITVFGAAGGRDTLKRPIMGKVSTSMCDHVIFTEHDNRGEEVETITCDIISGAVQDNWEFILDRTEAIRKAFSLAKPGDAVAIVGKGEEKFIYRAYGKQVWMGDEVCAAKLLKGEI